MMTIRIKKNKNYSVIHNTPIDDRNLSPEALGVVTYLLSKPDNWEVQNHEVRSRFSIGRDKMARIFKELKTNGYLVRTRRRGSDGKWEWETELNEAGTAKPQAAPTIDVKTVDGLPVDGSPVDGLPVDGKHVDIVSTESVSTESVSTELISRSEKSPQNTTIKEFIQSIQSLVGWNPKTNGGVPLLAGQRKRLDSLCRWLIQEAGATYNQIQEAKDYFTRKMKFTSPPTPEQVQEHWSKIINQTKGKNDEHNSELSSSKSQGTNKRQSQRRPISERLSTPGAYRL